MVRSTARGNGSRASRDLVEADQPTRAAIVDAAARAFAKQGYAATTNKVIAVGANVAPGLIYHYFESKLDLFVAAYQQVTRYRYERSRAVLDSEEPLADKIRALARDLVDMWEDDSTYVDFHARTLYEAQHEPAMRDSLKAARRETEALWTGIVEDAKNHGQVCEEFSSQIIVDACISWSTGLVMRLPMLGRERALATTELFVAGIESLRTRH